MKHECDCGAMYSTTQEVISCGDRNHGRTRFPSREHLVALLKKAQNRLRNQGDVPELTHKANLLVHDEIELALGGDLFLVPVYFPPDPEDCGKGAPEDYPTIRDKGM